jgi:hypothetical protein
MGGIDEGDYHLLLASTHSMSIRTPGSSRYDQAAL